MDFEIVNNPAVLERLSKIKGVGRSTMEKIQEFLTTGSIRRIYEFETDPDRIAMKNMMDIWGVGCVTVSVLVSEGQFGHANSPPCSPKRHRSW